MAAPLDGSGARMTPNEGRQARMQRLAGYRRSAAQASWPGAAIPIEFDPGLS
jgi:hypothetical protein